MIATDKLAQAFLDLADNMRSLAKQREQLAQSLRGYGPGKYPGATVYRVKKTTVRAHVRRAYTAVMAH